MGDHRRTSVRSATSITSGVAVGLVHAGLAVVLWNRWFDSLGELLATKPLNGVYVALGMFLLGFVPAVFYTGQRVVSPAVIVAVLLVLTGLGSWVSGPALAPGVGPTPFGLYVLGWVGIVVLVTVVGRWERRRKRSGED